MFLFCVCVNTDEVTKYVFPTYDHTEPVIVEAKQGLSTVLLL